MNITFVKEHVAVRRRSHSDCSQQKSTPFGRRRHRIGWMWLGGGLPSPPAIAGPRHRGKGTAQGEYFTVASGAAGGVAG
jgi:hypothetical protein